MNDERERRFGAGRPPEGGSGAEPGDDIEILGIEAVDEDESDGFEPAIEEEDEPAVAEAPRPAPA